MACRCNSVYCDDCGERAERKARRFLYRHLTRKQKESLRASKYFEVKGGESGRTYEIYYDGDDSVYAVDNEGNFVTHYCLCVMDEEGHDVPEGDRVLARKLLIESLESRFLAVANATGQ